MTQWILFDKQRDIRNLPSHITDAQKMQRFVAKAAHISIGIIYLYIYIFSPQMLKMPQAKSRTHKTTNAVP